MKKSWYRIVCQSPDVAEVMIYDEISTWGISAQDFVKELNAITAKTIRLRINSPGGSVFDGLAIYNALNGCEATVNVEIDGIAASIASVIALAGDSVCIKQNAFMMIHNPMSMVFGDADEMRRTADVLDKLAGSIAKTYADKTGKKLDEIQKAMSAETWFDADEAKAYGLVDRIDEDDDDEDADMPAAVIQAALKYAKLPERLKKIAAVLTATKVPLPKEPAMANKVIQKDGKSFAVIDGKEHEVEIPMIAATAAIIAPSKDEIEKATKDAADKAVEKERAYNKEFRTVMATANLSGKAAEEFEKFYGRPIDDVKFLASHAIGTRAKPVGEGSGEPEKDATNEAEKKIADEAGKRFDEERGVRRMYGVMTDDKNSDQWKSARGRHVAAAIRQAAKAK